MKPAHRQQDPQLSATEWAVLGLIAARPQHGFAVAKRLAEDGDVGQVWTVPRPLVYRAMRTLVEAGMTEETEAQASESGPPRTPVRATEMGREQLQLWLDRPVTRIRELRSLFLLKLALLEETGGDPTGLADRQLTIVRDQTGSLERRLEEASPGLERNLVLFRLETSRGAERFLEALTP